MGTGTGKVFFFPNVFVYTLKSLKIMVKAPVHEFFESKRVESAAFWSRGVNLAPNLPSLNEFPAELTSLGYGGLEAEVPVVTRPGQLGLGRVFKP